MWYVVWYKNKIKQWLCCGENIDAAKSMAQEIPGIAIWLNHNRQVGLPNGEKDERKHS